MDTPKIPKNFMRQDFMQRAKEIVDIATGEGNIKHTESDPIGFLGGIKIPAEYSDEIDALRETAEHMKLPLREQQLREGAIINRFLRTLSDGHSGDSLL